MNPTKLDGIARWPPPENVKQLWSFLGFCNFYRRFIDHYADKTVALNVLLRKMHPWDWTTSQHSAFEVLNLPFVQSQFFLCQTLRNHSRSNPMLRCTPQALFSFSKIQMEIGILSPTVHSL